MSTPVKYAAGFTLTIARVEGGFSVMAKNETTVYLHTTVAPAMETLLPHLNAAAYGLESESDLQCELWVRGER